jgi:endonuclease/exonuclease/phosphatase family metal-dependent hydrolase
MFIVHKIIFPINLIFFVLLLGSYATPYVDPREIWWISLLGLAYPFLVVINVIFVIYWTIFLKLKALYSLAAVFLGLNHFSHYVQFSSKKDDNDDHHLYRMISFNTHFFGYGEKKVDTRPFFDFIKEQEPYLVCLQEFLSESAPRKNYVSKLSGAMGQKVNIYFDKCLRAMDTLQRNFGLVIATTQPIIDTGFIEFVKGSNNRCTWADINFKGTRIRVYNVHFQSIKFDPEDYKFLNGKEEEQEEKLNKSMNILKKLRLGFEKRAEQVEVLLKHMKSCPYPILLCGDFNDTPVSYSYGQFSHLKDAFVESGVGLSRTYAGKMPSFRIDYILGSEEITFKNYHPSGKFFSDHRTLVADFNVGLKNE